MDEHEDGEESIAESMGAAIARAAGEQQRRIRSGEGMLGSAARRERRPAFAIATLVFVLGFAVSTTLVSGDESSARDAVIQSGYDQAQAVAAGFTAKDFAKPISGPTYERLAATTWKSVSTTGTVTGVRVWSSNGKILFSLNKSRVGATDPEMKPVLARASRGSDWYRVVDDTVQTFTPVSESADGPVHVVEVDQPIAAVEARVGDFWKQLRFGFALALIGSLALLVLTFFTPAGVKPARTRRRAVDEEEREEEEQEEDEQEEQEVEEWVEAEAEVTQGDVDAEEPAPAKPAALEPAPAKPAALEPVAAQQPASYREVLRALHQTEDLVPEPEPVQVADEPAPTVEAEPAPTVHERIQAAAPEPTSAVEHDIAPAADEDAVDPQELLRRRREEFKARAQRAGLRAKKTDPELQEAASAPNSEQ